jgi:hypothetical protein
VLEAVALAPVAVLVPEDPAVPPADDELPAVAVALVPVPVVESVVGRSETLDEELAAEEEDGAVVVTPALAEEQLSPALMAEQKAEAAGSTSSALVC